MPLLTIALSSVVVLISGFGGAHQENRPIAGALASGGIVLMGVDGSTQVRVAGTGSGSDPAWSPDGKWLAFTTARDVTTDTAETIVSDLYVIRPDGTGRRLVAHNAGSPAWSPDGRTLAFGRDYCFPRECPAVPNTIELYLISVDGRDLRRLTFNGVYDGEPSWSPDGRRIVYATDDGLFLMNADGTEKRRLTRGYLSNPAWSPDGRRIAFDTFRNVFVLDLMTGRATRLTPRAGNHLAPAWSADGRRIAFLATEACGTGCTAEELLRVWVMNADGTGRKPITRTGYVAVDWSRA